MITVPKKIIWKIYYLLIFFETLGLLAVGFDVNSTLSASNFKRTCAKVGTNLKDCENPSQASGARRKKPKLKWTQRMKGAISELRFSKNGKVVLVATSPDQDIPGSAHHYLLTQLNSEGHVEWEFRPKSPIRELGVSEDGSLIVISNYGNEIIGLDSKGKQIWVAEGTCRPILLDRIHNVLCYHDDDAEPHVAFDVFNWKGEKLLSFPIQSDILTLKLSSDERNLVLGLTDGEIVLLGPKFSPVWKKKVEGEILDLAVSSGEVPQVFALYKSQQKGQEILGLNEKGEKITHHLPQFPISQLEVAPQGDSLFYFGNGKMGQNLGGFSVSASYEPWKKGGAAASEYSYSISVDSVQVLMGYEEIQKNSRTTHLLSYDFEGNLNWDLPITRDESAYLYAHRIAAKGSGFVVGTDDSRVTYFHE